MTDEKPCGCHPNMPNERTPAGGWQCLGCGWGGRADVWLNATDVPEPKPREVIRFAEDEPTKPAPMEVAA